LQANLVRIEPKKEETTLIVEQIRDIKNQNILSVEAEEKFSIQKSHTIADFKSQR